MEPSAPQATFSPSPDLADRLLADFLDAELPLTEIAAQCKVTLAALADYLALPETADRLAQLEAASAQRTRLIATAHLPRLASILARMIDAHQDEAAHIPVDPRNLKAQDIRRRAHDNARKAATLLTRLARFTPPLASSRTPTSPPSTPSTSRRRAPTHPLDPAALPPLLNNIHPAAAAPELQPTAHAEVLPCAPQLPSATASRPQLVAELAGAPRSHHPSDPMPTLAPINITLTPSDIAATTRTSTLPRTNSPNTSTQNSAVQSRPSCRAPAQNAPARNRKRSPPTSSTPTSPALTPRPP